MNTPKIISIPATGRATRKPGIVAAIARFLLWAMNCGVAYRIYEWDGHEKKKDVIISGNSERSAIKKWEKYWNKKRAEL